MTGRMARPGRDAARAAINNEQGHKADRADAEGRSRGSHARGSSGRESARPVPIRPAADRTHRLLLEGRLAHDTAPELEAVLDELCDAGIGKLVLDLGDLGGIDLTGMGVIAMRCELCRRRGVAVRVERLGGAVREAFSAAGMLDRLPLSARSEG